jgi:site-specific recombinase XerD
MTRTDDPHLARQHLAKMLQCGRGYVNLWKGEIGRPLSYSSVNELVRRTRELVGFHFTVHALRHTFATLAYRDGVALEVIGAVLTHRSRSSTLVYTHLTARISVVCWLSAGCLTGWRTC